MRGVFIVLAAGSLSIANPAATQTGEATQTPAPAPVDEDQQADAVVQAIRAALEGKPDDARVGALEAQLAFVLDQANAGCGATTKALNTVLQGDLSNTARAALRNLSTTVSRCQNEGTGATGSVADQQADQGPNVAVGGGTSDYVAP
ncbi:hypothetical protein ACNFJ7_07225 [Sphingomonas sp. HT-1]|uniref:hypothetical protein n=1 Tax=unclassified Sphingomonas TaxID=196159 RepID=UPI0002DA8B36|nr:MULTISPECIES: hypothetical protein [unclassified Sphingomonas]KTF68825.1 hypothetical protein ATB93_12135 [Sphingomonas sp. WG]